MVTPLGSGGPNSLGPGSFMSSIPAIMGRTTTRQRSNGTWETIEEQPAVVHKPTTAAEKAAEIARNKQILDDHNEEWVKARSLKVLRDPDQTDDSDVHDEHDGGESNNEGNNHRAEKKPNFSQIEIDQMVSEVTARSADQREEYLSRLPMPEVSESFEIPADIDIRDQFFIRCHGSWKKFKKLYDTADQNDPNDTDDSDDGNMAGNNSLVDLSDEELRELYLMVKPNVHLAQRLPPRFRGFLELIHKNKKPNFIQWMEQQRPELCADTYQPNTAQQPPVNPTGMATSNTGVTTSPATGNVTGNNSGNIKIVLGKEEERAFLTKWLRVWRSKKEPEMTSRERLFYTQNFKDRAALAAFAESKRVTFPSERGAGNNGRNNGGLQQPHPKKPPHALTIDEVLALGHQLANDAEVSLDKRQKKYIDKEFNGQREAFIDWYKMARLPSSVTQRFKYANQTAVMLKFQGCHKDSTDRVELLRLLPEPPPPQPTLHGLWGNPQTPKEVFWDKPINGDWRNVKSSDVEVEDEDEEEQEPRRSLRARPVNQSNAPASTGAESNNGGNITDDQETPDDPAGDQGASDDNAGDQGAADDNAGDQGAADDNAGDQGAADDNDDNQDTPDGSDDDQDTPDGSDDDQDTPYDEGDKPDSDDSGDSDADAAATPPVAPTRPTFQFGAVRSDTGGKFARKSVAGNPRSRKGPAKGSGKGKGKAKGPRKPGAAALREIRYYQNHVNARMIPKAPFARLVKQIIGDVVEDRRNLMRPVNNLEYRIQATALEALKEASELYLTALFADTNLAAIHGNRVTIQQKDMQLALQLRGDKKMMSTPMGTESPSGLFGRPGFGGF